MNRVRSATGRVLRATLLSITVVAPSWGVAATLEGQQFADTIAVSNWELKLNGLGVRVVMIFKGYVAGLYLSQKASTFFDVAALPGPKRLELRMMRGAGPDDFIDALVDGIRQNSSPSELRQLEERVEQLKVAIKSIGKAARGDVIQFDYAPDVGTVLVVNGASKGAAIKGKDFFDAVLKIFVGENPVDTGLKSGLLSK